MSLTARDFCSYPILQNGALHVATNGGNIIQSVTSQEIVKLLVSLLLLFHFTAFFILVSSLLC